MQTLRHSTGFGVRFDDAALAASEIERGYQFTSLDAATRRSPVLVELTLDDGERPAGAWPQARSVGDRTAAYRIDRREGGSGGDLFVLSAWLPCGSRHLLVRQDAQAETEAEADFAPAWAILGAASCP